MTPKEKAEVLIKMYYKYSNSTDCRDINDNTYTSWKKEFFTNNEMWKNNAKQCALICVDEILINLGNLYAENWIEISEIEQNSIFWEQVKQEIEKL